MNDKHIFLLQYFYLVIGVTKGYQYNFSAIF